MRFVSITTILVVCCLAFVVEGNIFRDMFLRVAPSGRRRRAREAVTTMRTDLKPQRLSTLLAARVPAQPVAVCMPAAGQAYVGGLPQAQLLQPAWRSDADMRGQQAQAMTSSAPATVATLLAPAFIGIEGTTSTTSGTDNYIGTATTATGEGMAASLRDRMVLTVDLTIEAAHKHNGEARGVPPRGRPV